MGLQHGQKGQRTAFQAAMLASLFFGILDVAVLEVLVTRHSHRVLDQPSKRLDHYANGPAALEWLSNPHNIIQKPAATTWAHNLVVGYAAGYNYEILKPLIYGFLGHVDEPSQLVLLTLDDDIKGLPGTFNDRVIVQKHEMPEHLSVEDLPYVVSLRFFVVSAFLKVTGHDGSIFFLDTRDVFIQRDPFAKFPDKLLHFPQESTSYRLKGPFTINNEWLLNCYGNETMKAIGGMFVLNSGTLLGPTKMLVEYFGLLQEEMKARWHCMRHHGSDQAIHNYLVYTGRLISSGIEYQLEDQVSGPFAFVAYTHPEVYHLLYVNENRDELYNRQFQPMVAIHLWPGKNDIARRVVMAYVAEVEELLQTQERHPSTLATAGV